MLTGGYWNVGKSVWLAEPSLCDSVLYLFSNRFSQSATNKPWKSTVPREFILSSIFFFFIAFFFFFCTSNVHIDRGLEMCVQAFALAVVGIWSGTSCLITLV